MQATVLFGHGSSDPSWRVPIDKVAQRIRDTEPDAQVRCAFLERTEPDLPTTVAELVQSGATGITIVPMFLGVGKHAREDMPLLVTQLQADYPDVCFALQPSVGEEPRVIDLLARIASPLASATRS
ncbi:MAG: CbiX/SirB N-terminal domain-containing protein [Rhodoferax sp.]|uniref:sirohydrochlorin chelatase n=1 Tax=Rhodoferax sp. TaxID=50421 RepID=UPI001B4190F4|nr:CbiX/SirB N-terminal domain-containing protein [Rhodoferax sp.]MBP9906830.1 CbiX/SirB N-terminal domain-containing protein [Rhodoferax sp.]